MTTDNNSMLFWIVLGSIILFLFIISSIIKIIRYIPQRNYIKTEMGRSHSEREYKHWKKKLIRLRLQFIPIIGYFIGR